MTLDEAIKHCEEIAEKYCEKVEDGLTADDFCDSCASEHRQLAEWLKELKAYRSLRFSIGEILVDESKWHISSEKAIEKIRNKMVDFDSEQRR